MAYQYDVEEQADCFGAPFPMDAEWRRFFSPIAPVQLASRWSPFDDISRVLGEPIVSATDTDDFSGCHCVAGFWSIVQVSDAKPPAPVGTPDEKRFLGLLAVAIGRAQTNGAGLLLVVKPGWSYDTVQAVSDETAALMKQHGFIVTDRRPGLTTGSS